MTGISESACTRFGRTLTNGSEGLDPLHRFAPQRATVTGIGNLALVVGWREDSDGHYY